MKRTEQTTFKPKYMGKTSKSYPVINVRKTQRNEKCPCGSGIKFKKCCLEN